MNRPCHGMWSQEQPNRQSSLAVQRPWYRIWLWALAAMVAFTAPGCGGCGGSNKNANKTPEELKAEEEERKRQEEMPDFTVGDLRTLPSSQSRIGAFVKPGHWSVASIDVTANKFDLPNGELTTEPLKLDGMPFRMGSSRDALLSKSQKKSLPIVLYVPPGRSSTSIEARVSRSGGGIIEQKATGVSRMPAHQFHMVVLTDKPDLYNFLPRMASIRPYVWNESVQLPAFYRVHIPDLTTESLPLPDNSLCWTSTAFLIWDGLAPETLDQQQQTALVDWLHWGGQLVVSGPGTLDLLNQGFLAELLPAKPGRDITLNEQELQEFAEEWTPDTLGRRDQRLQLAEGISAKELLVDEEDPNVRVLATTRSDNGVIPMTVERRVGRGRFVVTAFGLSQKQLVTPAWSAFDSFFNACVLLRPPRTFFRSGVWEELGARWAGGNTSSPTEPSLQSRVRYFTRDARAEQGVVKIDGQSIESFDGILIEDQNSSSLLQQSYEEDEVVIGPGVAGWTDFNIASATARETLRKAAGIVIPDASFVLRMLAIYVVVLVPVNWMIFRLIGRVEWAWIAAPVITIAFALIVINQAELDIGFARARAELNVIELQGDYSRAHVTRFTSLYTSLTTAYDTRYTDSTAIVQPFARLGAHERRQTLIGDTPTTINYRRTPTRVTLSGFEVSSNSTEMLHSEHMLDLGGGIHLKSFNGQSGAVVNNTDMDLKGAAILTQDSVAWIGDINAGAESSFQLQDRSPESGENTGELLMENYWFPEREESPYTAKDSSSLQLDLRPLIQLLEARGSNATRSTFPEREIRLVAWNVDLLPGMEVEPAASQVRVGNVILAHLRHEPLPEPKKNDNTPGATGAREFDGIDDQE
ncbi:MAG: hypothetical protein MPJ50_05885 [Pirellulales bacterium]|nr:hypothetical protein [Pirellulales bacterium]